MLCHRPATSRLALPAPSHSTLCRRSSAALRRAMPSHSKLGRTALCHRTAEPCGTMPSPSGAPQCGEMPCLCESAQCPCYACLHYAAAPQAVSLPCAIAMPSLPRPCIAIHCATLPPALPLHSWPMRRSAYRCPCSAQHCRSITELISAPATPCQASPPPDFVSPGFAKPPRIIAPLWLAAAIHGLTVPCRCQVGQCIAVPSLRWASPCRRFATRTSHCLCAAHLALPPPY